jgi:hypothetical protein
VQGQDQRGHWVTGIQPLVLGTLVGASYTVRFVIIDDCNVSRRLACKRARTAPRVVGYFLWRQPPFAQEQMHSRLNLPGRHEFSRGGREVAAAANDLMGASI